MANLSLFGEFDGIEMGVFEDGTPFLTGKGLAFLSGVEPETIRLIGIASDEEKGRSAKITALLRQIGYSSNELYRKIVVDGQEKNAYPESVCLAVIRYYAEQSLSGKRSTDKAKEVVWIFFQKTFLTQLFSIP